MINCVIIDDEPLARKGIREYVEDVDFLLLTGEFDSPLKATELLGKGEVQLLFLDIQMPKITGIEFFKSLKNAPPVIFTTAYPQYALDGFDLNALDYLVKPVSFDRFLKAAMRAKEYYELREENNKSAKDNPGGKDHFFIKAGSVFVRINYADILFVEALQNYVTVHTKEKKYITYLTFKSVEEYLPSEKFLKVHKSFIVSLDQIESIEGTDIRIGTHLIPISRNLREQVMERILKNKILKR